MLAATAVESSISYIFTVNDDETRFTFTYEFTKHQEKTPKRIFAEDGKSWTYDDSEYETNPMSKKDYIHACKNEALLLAQHEIDGLKQPVPLSI